MLLLLLANCRCRCAAASNQAKGGDVSPCYQSHRLKSTAFINQSLRWNTQLMDNWFGGQTRVCKCSQRRKARGAGDGVQNRRAVGFWGDQRSWIASKEGQQVQGSEQAGDLRPLDILESSCMLRQQSWLRLDKHILEISFVSLITCNQSTGGISGCCTPVQGRDRLSTVTAGAAFTNAAARESHQQINPIKP